MSRIDEALKRASAGIGQAPAAVPLQGEVAPNDVFADAWKVADAPFEPKAAVSAVATPPRVLAQDAVPVERTADALKEDAANPAPGSSDLALFHDFNPSVVEKIVATPTVRPASVEQYRRLAGTLHHAQIEQNIKVVMVTSAVAGEGKTLTATNLALTFSESYRRSVLLVDADLRKPTLHETFQVPNITGLGDGLRASDDQKLSLIQISARLTLLTAGRPDPDPMSGLTSERMKHLLAEASARFDWVVIDTPPVGLLPDADLLARMVDATLFVVRAGKTPYPVIQKAIATLGRDRVMGVVLNAADETLETSYSYYKYYDTYGKKNGK